MERVTIRPWWGGGGGGEGVGGGCAPSHADLVGYAVPSVVQWNL